MAKKEKFYLTTSIPYANAEPHLGHALELLYADIMARYQIRAGREVFYLTGTDEHGQKMHRTAQEAGVAVEKYAAEKSACFLALADEWNIINNDFIRTTEPRHLEAAAKFWQLARANGDIYKQKYSGYYCVGCEAFITEKELVAGECPVHHKKPETVQEENYFFKLSRYQEPLEFLFQNNPNFIYPANRHKEMLNILKSGLKDISISRDREKLPWGVPVPDDDSQVMYVWFDALTNYLSGLGWGSGDEKNFKKFWPADAHLVGKDINRFHALLWPAMLMSAGLELPKQIVVHGFITLNGQKMSKSLGNVLDPRVLTQKYPLDAIRYFLAREIILEEDGDFSEKKFQERHTADLANGLGNLANRIFAMVHKFSAGRVPEVAAADEDMMTFVREVDERYNREMAAWRFDRALEEIWRLVARLDQTISDKKPWEMNKAGKITELGDLLYHLLEGLRHIAVDIYPVMPETAEKILAIMNLDPGQEWAKPLAELQQWVGLKVGQEIKTPEVLFPRI